MKKRNMDSPKAKKKQWVKGKANKPYQETLRSLSAPQAARTPPAAIRTRTPVRSFSATEQPAFRNDPNIQAYHDKYDFAYFDVTSPSEDEEEKQKENVIPEEVEPGNVHVGPPKKVVTTILPGSGLQRAQVRPAVRSFNTRVRDLASVFPLHGNQESSPPVRPTRSKASKCWLEDEFKDETIKEDSLDLEDVDEVGVSMKSDENLLEIAESNHVMHEEKYEEEKTETFNHREQLYSSQSIGEGVVDLKNYGSMKIEEHLDSLKMGERNRLKLEEKLNKQLKNRLKNMNLVIDGRKTPAGAGMLAVKEDLEDEVSEFPPEVVPAGAGDMATLMENMKKGGLSARQTQLSQLASSQSALSQQHSSSQTQVTSSTSSTTQMVSNSSTSHSTTSRQLASARLHHLTSEMKAKSDLSDLKNSISEMKHLSSSTNFSQRLRNSMENLVDATDPDNEISEPLVTFPDPETPPVPVVSPPPLTPSLGPPLSLVSDGTGMNSTTSSLDTMKFEQKRMTSASSKTKMVRENFSASEGASTEMSGLQGYQAKGARTQHQRIAREEMAASHSAAAFTQEQRSQEALKVDSFSSQQAATSSTSSIAQQQARQTMSSGVFSSQEKHVAQSNMTITSSKNVSTKSSVMSSASQIGQLMNGTVTPSDEDLANMKFDDLDRLCAQSSPKEVEMAITKYSSRMDAFVKRLKKHHTGELDTKKTTSNLNKINEMIRRAWAVPTYGHELGYSLCNVLRNSGGLDLLMLNCVEDNDELQFSSAQLLEQCLTTENRAHVVDHGLEKVVTAACRCTNKTNSVDHSRVGTGILEHLFKHSEETCSDVIRLGGLDAVLFECRKNDVEILRHCAGALANLSLYGGAENQEAMINRKVPMWLFPLALHNDDNIKYYACLAIAVLVANGEIEAAVLKSGTLDLVEPFVTSHNPSDFARSNLAHAHGQSKNWLQRLVPVLSSKREEARNLAAFHFCMEAGIKKQQNNTDIFREIGAIDPLKIVASCPNAVASKYAAKALRLIGEEIPHKLSQQVPLWSIDDVREWVKQIGFSEYATSFLESRVDGDLLLQLTEETLKNDIGLSNGIKRQRFIRELQILKRMADYSSKDAGNLHSFLTNIGIEYGTYTYSMINAGVDKETIRILSDEQLETECCITNSIHRQRILNTIRANENNLSSISSECLDKSLDVFVSYRRSNGSQLASLLKVHLQLRGFSVFIDVERLEAGKFDNNLLQSIRQAKHFLLVLTPKALDRCINDAECKDWIHREIVAALESHCNIIPIIDNFAWPEPEELPEDMRQVCHFNGVRWIHDYQDACVDKLERFMRGELKEGFLGRGPLVGSKEAGSTAPPTPAALTRPPPTYQRMHSSDSSKGSDKDQNGRTE